MITEDYVSFEIAKLLKEKGFNESCYTYYDDIDNSIDRFDKGLHFNNTSYPWGIPYDVNKAKKYVVAPTLQMAMKWLREMYQIDIQVFRHIRGKRITFYARIEQNTHLEHQDHCNLYQFHEQACEAAIRYSLENLI